MLNNEQVNKPEGQKKKGHVWCRLGMFCSE